MLQREARQVWLVRAPLHDGRWRMWPPDLLERIASALMLRRVPARIIDAAARPATPGQLADLARGETNLIVALWSNRVEQRTVVAWLTALRERAPELPLAVVGPLDDGAPFLRVGANLVLRGEADNAVEELLTARAGEQRDVVAPPALDPAAWPLPAREHLPPEYYFDRTAPAAHPPLAVVEVTRPAPTRRREPEAIAGEIDLLAQTGGARSVALLDDDLAADPAFLARLARLLGGKRPRIELLVQVRPRENAAEAARLLRWCGAAHAIVDVGDVPAPGLAEQTIRALNRAGLMTRVQVDASRPEPVLRAALLLARRAHANDITFVGEGRRIETTRARKRFLQRPGTMARNLVLTMIRRPLWWADLRFMVRPLVER